MAGAVLGGVETGQEHNRDPILCSNVNIGFWERWGSFAAGAVLATLGVAQRSPAGLLMTAGGGYLAYRGYKGHCLAYEKAGKSTAQTDGVEVHQQFTVFAAPAEVFRFWKDFSNLPRFMRHLAKVQVTGAGRSRWTVDLPLGRRLEWEAVIVDEIENESLRWHSVPDSVVEAAGEVRLRTAPGDRGTEVRVRMAYQPPGGLLGETAAWLARPITAQLIKEDLRRFKRLIEAGEIPTLEGQPTGAVEPNPAEVNLYCRRRTLAPSVHTQTADEQVLEASAQTFPASDAPGWTTTAAGAPK